MRRRLTCRPSSRSVMSPRSRPGRYPGVISAPKRDRPQGGRVFPQAELDRRSYVAARKARQAAEATGEDVPGSRRRAAGAAAARLHAQPSPGSIGPSRGHCAEVCPSGARGARTALPIAGSLVGVPWPGDYLGTASRQQGPLTPSPQRHRPQKGSLADSRPASCRSSQDKSRGEFSTPTNGEWRGEERER